MLLQHIGYTCTANCNEKSLTSSHMDSIWNHGNTRHLCSYHFQIPAAATVHARPRQCPSGASCPGSMATLSTIQEPLAEQSPTRKHSAKKRAAGAYHLDGVGQELGQHCHGVGNVDDLRHVESHMSILLQSSSSKAPANMPYSAYK